VTIKPGNKINLAVNQGPKGTNTTICQDITSDASGRMAMFVNNSLCVAPSPSPDTGSAATTSQSAMISLFLETCTATNAAQVWAIPPVDAHPKQVKHKATGLCLTATNTFTIGLAACASDESSSYAPDGNEQVWILGTSGRLCAPSGCLSVVV
jgi:hypothetical protein